MRRIPRYNSEHNLYEQIARYLQLQYPNVIYRFDIAADLKLTPGQAAKHKRLHPERGYPDLFIAEPKIAKARCGVLTDEEREELEKGMEFISVKIQQNYYGLYLEIKKDGEKLTKKDGSWRTPHIAEQAEMLERLRQAGYKAEFGVGFDECKQIIDEYIKKQY
nr:MAG TPA: Nuclease [Caudoviricetes sp.]